MNQANVDDILRRVPRPSIPSQTSASNLIVYHSCECSPIQLMRGDLGKSGYVIGLVLVGLLVAVIFMPQIRRAFLNFRAETVTINLPAAPGTGLNTKAVDLEIVTILGKDGIPAILDPQFLLPADASQMKANERVIGLSINGEHRAYPLNLLSRHEIVNDTVGGVPVAVTW